MFVPPGVATPALSSNPLGWAVLAGMTALAVLPQLFKRDVDEDNAVATLNQIEASLWEGMSQYFNTPASAQAQQAFLIQFDEAYKWLSGAGIGTNTAIDDVNWRRQAVIDRSRGGKYDWFSSIRDPVANDPRVQGMTLASVFGSFGSVEEIASQVGLTTGQLLTGVAVVCISLWLLFRK